MDKKSEGIHSLVSLFFHISSPGHKQTKIKHLKDWLNELLQIKLHNHYISYSESSNYRSYKPWLNYKLILFCYLF